MTLSPQYGPFFTGFEKRQVNQRIFTAAFRVPIAPADSYQFRRLVQHIFQVFFSFTSHFVSFFLIKTTRPDVGTRAGVTIQLPRRFVATLDLSLTQIHGRFYSAL
jgi:hypothetical protein